MNGLRRAAVCFLLLGATSADADDFFDRLEEVLTVSALQNELRARVSGTVELEGYHLEQPAPGLIYTSGNNLFNPRLSLFLDVQAGRHIYAFAQVRVDRGFDPSDEKAETRLDEYAIRWSAGDSRFNLQVGKFGTVVGNWVQRHGSWDNPFITAPLPYENLTAIWDGTAARSSSTLVAWAHLGADPAPGEEYAEKSLRTPLIWGPSYARGAAIFGEFGRFKYAVEVKNAALSSRPDAWDSNEDQWRHPTMSGRVGYRPNAMWNLGISASAGPYLLPLATPTLAPGYRFGDYRQTVLAQDISFAWHRVQVWGECYEARFAVPGVGDADTVAYYVEGKYKLTPQFFASLRWNQQLFGTIPDGLGGTTRWGREAWRLDVAPTYRFTAQLQLKLQYSLLHENESPRAYSHLFAAQLVLRF
jgi:hypothetical protein